MVPVSTNIGAKSRVRSFLILIPWSVMIAEIDGVCVGARPGDASPVRERLGPYKET